MQIDPTLLDAPLSQLSDNDFKSFFDDYMSGHGIREKSVVTGRVLEIGDDWVTVDINFKAEGLIQLDEFRGPDGEITIAVGDEVDVYLDSMGNDDGNLVLSKEKADLMKAFGMDDEATLSS